MHLRGGYLDFRFPPPLFQQGIQLRFTLRFSFRTDFAAMGHYVLKFAYRRSMRLCSLLVDQSPDQIQPVPVVRRRIVQNPSEDAFVLPENDYSREYITHIIVVIRLALDWILSLWILRCWNWLSFLRPYEKIIVILVPREHLHRTNLRNEGPTMWTWGTRIGGISWS